MKPLCVNANHFLLILGGGQVGVQPFDVSVLDLSLAPESFSLPDYLSQTKPVVIGVTSFNYCLKDSLALGETAKQASPESLRVIGGWEASPRAAELIKGSAFDVVIRNEGEEALVEVATLVRETGKEAAFSLFPEIKGLTFINASGELVETPIHTPNLGLDEYPFLHESFPAFEFTGYPEEGMVDNGLTYLHGSRGCVFACVYCANPAIYSYKIRYRSVENIMAEIRELYLTGYRIFSFRDEIFTANPTRARNLIAAIKALQAEGIFIKWFCQTRADLLDEQMITDMKDSGLIKLIFGIESGDPEVVSYLKASRIDVAKFAAHTNQARSNGLGVIHYYMFGGPKQTWQSMFKTLRFMLGASPTTITCQVVEDYPGNKTTGEVRPVLKTEAHLAKVLFENVFFRKHGANLFGANSEVLFKAQEPAVIGFRNAFRLAVVADLILRSSPDYSDKDRDSIMKGYAKTHEMKPGSFWEDYFELLADRETEKVLAIEMEADVENIARKIFGPLTMNMAFLDFGVHPKIADLYFDDFLSEISFTNAFHVLKGFRTKRLIRFLTLSSMLWEGVRQGGNPPITKLEFERNSDANSLGIEEMIETLKLTAVAKKLNECFQDNLKGVVEVNVHGLPIIVNVPERKIIVMNMQYNMNPEIEVRQISD